MWLRGPWRTGGPLRSPLRDARPTRASTVTSDRPKPAMSSWPISPASGSSALAASSAGCQAASRAFMWACRRLRPLENRCDALTAADAHRRERVPAAGPPELIQRLDGEDGTGSPDWMAEGDAAAVGIRLLRRQPEFADNSERLRGEGLIYLEHIDFPDFKPGTVEDLVYGGHRAHPHDPWLNPRVAVADQPAQRPEAAAAGERRVGEHHRSRGIV